MTIEKILILIINGLLVHVCYTDIRWRYISNKTTGLILLHSIMLGYVSSGGVSIVLPFAILSVGFLFFVFGAIGAGDIKLMSVLSVGLETDKIIDFLLLTSYSGFPLVLITIVYYRIFMPKDILTIPYGVALSSGYLWQSILNVY